MRRSLLGCFGGGDGCVGVILLYVNLLLLHKLHLFPETSAEHPARSSSLGERASTHNGRTGRDPCVRVRAGGTTCTTARARALTGLHTPFWWCCGASTIGETLDRAGGREDLPLPCTVVVFYALDFCRGVR